MDELLWGWSLPSNYADREKTKVFVSYSRKDSALVGRLADALEAGGDFHVFRDTEDILPSEEWRKRLEGLIAEADTIVFCLSAASASSEVCAWEVGVAESLNKRIVPLVIGHVDGPVPGGVAKLNYIFCAGEDDFETATANLVKALTTNIGWIREHTRLGEAARRWAASGELKDHLLRGVDVDAAEAWAGGRPSGAPELTHTTIRFIAESRQQALRQRRQARRIRNVFAGLALTLLAAGIAWFNQGYLRERYDWFTGVRPYRLTAERERALVPKETFKECAHCPEMVVLPAGAFLMGSPEGQGKDDERPQHEVTIGRAFAVSKFEVTFDQWDACAAAGFCKTGVSDSGWGRGKRPVINVSRDDAKKFLGWLSHLTGQPYRLLSEAEWEYAARAGATTAYSFGDEKAALSDYAWYADNAAGMTHPAGGKKPNAFGLHDMHGNVEEWVEDSHETTYEGAPLDGTPWLRFGDAGGRILRGGSWQYGPDALRSAARNWVGTGYWGDASGMGFRIARTFKP